MNNENNISGIFRQENTIWKAIIKPRTISETIEEIDNKHQLIEKTIACPTHHTLCWALNELANYEDEKGTKTFCDYVYKFPATFEHHNVTGGGNPNDKEIENTGFITLDFPKIKYSWYSIKLGIEVTPPTFPLYVDIEYVEMAYALHHKLFGHVGAQAAYMAWNTLKWVIQTSNGNGGTNFGHEPNKYGFILGLAIAGDSQTKTIRDFVNSWCVGATCRI